MIHGKTMHHFGQKEDLVTAVNYYNWNRRNLLQGKLKQKYNLKQHCNRSQAEKQTNRDTNRQTNRETNRETNRVTNRETNRQTCKITNPNRQKDGEIELTTKLERRNKLKFI